MKNISAQMALDNVTHGFFPIFMYPLIKNPNKYIAYSETITVCVHIIRLFVALASGQLRILGSGEPIVNTDSPGRGPTQRYPWIQHGRLNKWTNKKTL